jgi:hypothetical protein
VANKKGKFNIKPVHGDLTNLGSTSSHGTVHQFYNLDNKAYQNVTSIGSTSSHSTLKSSGYQYILLPLVSSTLVETQVMEDELSTQVTTFLTETFNILDLESGGNSFALDTGIILDQVNTFVSTNVSDVFILNDSASGIELGIEDQLGFTDFVTTFVSTSVEDYFIVEDEELSANQISITNFSFEIQILTLQSQYDSFRVEIPVYQSSNNGLEVNIQAYTLQGITTISGPATSWSPGQPTAGYTPYLNPPGIPLPTPQVDYSIYNFTPPNPPPFIPNPFTPTIIIGTSVLSQNVATYPAGYVPDTTSHFVQIANAPVGNANWCDLLNFNMTIDYSGGNFSAQSITPIGSGTDFTTNLNQQINVMGLFGAITGFGRSISNSLYGYNTTGIFGSVLLNKSLDLLCGSNQKLLGLLTNNNTVPYQNVNIVQNPQDSQAFNTFTTYKAAVNAIAQLAGISVGWNYPDFPLVTLSLQEGDTGLSAISSLVGQIGATLRWDGYNSYNVCYPNFFAGLFNVPSASLITAQGMADQYLLDLGTDSFGLGLRAIPTLRLLDPTQNPLVNGSRTSLEAVQKLGSITKLLTSSDPPSQFPLPQDYLSAKIQIIVPVGQATSGQYVTDDPTTWFDLGDASISNPYVKINTGLASPYAPYIQVDNTLFPNVNPVNNGNFTLNVGCTRNNQGQAYANAKIQREAQLYNLMLQTLNRFTYVKAYEGSISCYFFGAIPLPGMWASATACGYTVEGIVESVTFSAPGVLNISVAQYAMVDWVNNYVNIYPSLTIDNPVPPQT